MFTGIVEEVGRVKNIAKNNITICANKILEDLHTGDSISISGVCLTVTEFKNQFFTADIMPETLRRTILGKLYVNSLVNLERALAINGRLGGHLVSGHVDTMGKIVQLKKNDNAMILYVEVLAKYMRYIVPQGSITLDGISLTVVAVKENIFSVSLIPHTWANTALKTKNIGAYVNIETDILAKYVEKFFLVSKKEVGEDFAPTLTKEQLFQHGFC